MSMSFSEPIHGYPRGDVEEFLSAAAAERVRLEAEIAEAHARIAQARSAVGTHRVMVTMLLDAQRELSEIRRRAEAEAERMIAEAEIEAQAIERGRWSAFDVPTSVSMPSEPTIDLVGHADAQGSDQFFDYLRGALADDQPLGPRAD